MTSPLIIIQQARVYAPEPLGIKSLLIGGGKILAISDNPIELPSNLDVEVCDFDGKTLIPGFIDCHAHITGGGGEAGFATRVPPVPMSQFTSAGVTTVIGLLGTDDTSRSTEELLATVYGLREQGLSAYCWTGGYHLPLKTLTDSARKDIVYLEPVIGIGEFAISDHRSSQPVFDEVVRLASDAHVAGLMTGKAGVIHFHLGDGDRKLALIERALAQTEIPPRVFHPTHVNRNKPLFEKACELLVKGCYIDLTAFPEGSVEPGITAAGAVRSIIEQKLPLEQVTVSSDGGGCMPFFTDKGELTHMDFGDASTLGITLKELLNDGFSLEQVLPIFTSNVATLMRLQNKGRLCIGSDADLIILNDNNEISDVLAIGKWHKRNGNSIVKGFFEPKPA